MKIITTIQSDLSCRGVTPVVEVAQNDANTRCVALQLTDNGAAWEIPSGVTAAVAFRKSDGHKGLYDTLPDGSAAVTISGSTVTAILAPQVLTSAGDAAAAVVLCDKNLNRLATFPFTVSVSPDPSAGGALSNDYYKYATMEAVSEGVDAALAALEESKQDFLSKGEEALAAVHGAATEDAPAIICEAMGDAVTVTDASDRLLKGLTLYGKTTQSGAPSPDAPVALESAGARGSIDVTVAGKNLFGGEALAAKLIEVASATRYPESGAVKFTGGNVSQKTIFNTFKENTRYTFVLYGRNASAEYKTANLAIWYTDGSASYFNFSVAEVDSCLVFTSAAGKTIKRFYGRNSAASTILYPNQCGIFEGVLTEADFVPYEGQTLSVSTPNGLPGVPMQTDTAGIGKETYTDVNGQRWICDTIDFQRGMYLQRVVTKVLNGTEPWNAYGTTDISFRHVLGALGSGVNSACLCDKLSYGMVSNAEGVGFRTLNSDAFGWFQVYVRLPDEYDDVVTSVATFKAWLTENPLTLMYALAEPIETPLSAEELASFAALHTYKPNTTIYNDGGAGMEVSYVADTKTYIDQKLAAISAAMLNA